MSVRNAKSTEEVLDLIESAISVAQVYGSDADREIADVEAHGYETLTLVMQNGERWTVRVTKQDGAPRVTRIGPGPKPVRCDCRGVGYGQHLTTCSYFQSIAGTEGDRS